MLMTDVYGMAPGMTQARETYESEFRWGSQFLGIYANALIDGNTVDSGNSPTYELRPGLLLGQVIATGKYKNYSPSATDGSEVASAILLEAIRTQDFSGTSVDRFYSVLVGGPVQASKIINLDLMARSQMNKFIFDDIFNIQGSHWYPFKRHQTKTANYTVVGSDNFSCFDNLGAGGAVTVTLPAIAAGYVFSFRLLAAQTFAVASAEGSNLVGTTLTQNSVSANAIGAGFTIYSNPAGTKWIVENISSATQTLTYA